MEVLCEMTVEIGGHRKELEKEIIRACMVEWNFREDDFFHHPADDNRHEILEASALGTLYGNCDEKEIVERMERAVWHVNGRMCHVQVTAVRFDRHAFRTRVEDEELQIA